MDDIPGRPPPVRHVAMARASRATLLDELELFHQGKSTQRQHSPVRNRTFSTPAAARHSPERGKFHIMRSPTTHLSRTQVPSASLEHTNRLIHKLRNAVSFIDSYRKLNRSLIADKARVESHLQKTRRQLRAQTIRANTHAKLIQQLQAENMRLRQALRRAQEAHRPARDLVTPPRPIRRKSAKTSRTTSSSTQRRSARRRFTPEPLMSPIPSPTYDDDDDDEDEEADDDDDDDDNDEEEPTTPGQQIDHTIQEKDRIIAELQEQLTYRTQRHHTVKTALRALRDELVHAQEQLAERIVQYVPDSPIIDMPSPILTNHDAEALLEDDSDAIQALFDSVDPFET